MLKPRERRNSEHNVSGQTAKRLQKTTKMMSAKFDLKNNFLSIKKPKNSGKRKVKSYMRKESMNTLQDEGNGDEESSLIEFSSISSCSFGSLEGLNKPDRASKVQMLSKAVL